MNDVAIKEALFQIVEWCRQCDFALPNFTEDEAFLLHRLDHHECLGRVITDGLNAVLLPLFQKPLNYEVIVYIFTAAYGKAAGIHEPLPVQFFMISFPLLVRRP